jgi:DNA-binding MurR/RpiR family transcriptional regulator
MKRNLIAMIEEGMHTFSKGQKRIANYILEHYDKAAYMTASKLGTLVGVSESTVVRFAIELGFEGYPEMQKSLQELIRMKLTSVQRVEVTNSLIGEGDVLEKILMSDAEKIRRTLEEVDRDAFEAAVDKIVAADKIYIIGVRSSSSLAGFLNFNFRMIFDNVKFVQTTSGSEMFEQIMSIGPNDVMIAISFPRYSKVTLSTAQFARDRGATIVAVTDSEMSPVYQMSETALLAPCEMISFVDSMVAPLSLLNALLVALAQRIGMDVSLTFEELEDIWNEYGVFGKMDDE